jgi:hypothetical protein
MDASRVNREESVIEGVCVVTAGVEARGHDEYTDEFTLKTFQDCAQTHSDGVKVKMGHGSGVSSIVGSLRNFRTQGGKLLADLHLLKSNPMREHIMEIAETIPGSFGLSVSFSGFCEEIGGKEFARCIELYSVDIVDRPAANPSGLFSIDSRKQGKMDNKSLLARFKEFLAGVEKEADPTNFEAKAKELETQLSAKDTELKDRDAKIVEIEAAIDSVKKDFAAKEEALAKKETEFSARVETAASEKARLIMTTLGVPQVANPPAKPMTGNTAFEQKVKEQIASGKTKAQAVQFCVKEFPAEYAEWRKSGDTSKL